MSKKILLYIQRSLFLPLEGIGMDGSEPCMPKAGL